MMHWKTIFNRASLKITLVYFVVSFLWIFFSDLILLKLTQEETLITQYQTIKGGVFVAVTSLLIFYLARREFFKKDESLKAINKAKEEYQALYEAYLTLSEKLKSSNKKLEDKNDQLRSYFRRISESQERYRAFISQISEGVYRLDLPQSLDTRLSPDDQTNYLYQNLYIGECNPRLAGMYHFASMNELIGQKLKDLSKTELSRDLYRLIRSFVESDYNVRDVETRSTDRAGKTKYFNNNITGIIKDEKLIRVWGTQQDITAMKNNQEELIRQKEKAEESNRIKNAFLANISHEIRTPLNSIMGFSELLDNPQLSEDDQRNYIGHVKNSGNQLLRIVSDILDVSFIQTGQLSLNQGEFHLNELMNDIRLQLERSVDQKEMNIGIRMVPGLEDGQDQIIADKDRLYQVLSNLSDNAVKFTHQGQVEIGYKVLADRMMQFYVRDTGIGIPRAKRSMIFEHFRQGEEYANRHYGGIGLGLSIVKGIVETMGGKVYLESEPDNGSVFRFNIPYNKPNGKELRKDVTNKLVRTKKILIVEDQPDNFKLLQEFLIDTDVTILHAESGEKSLELFASHNDIDLVLMDLRLPGLDGIQTTRKIKEQSPGVPVIAQTAYMREQYPHNKDLFEDYLTKPISRKNFSKVTSRLLDIVL
ncbi:MAG: response regulator [Bacteroidales bacterium]|nr:response regulator [Bacteroidales bacterium]